MSYTPNLRKKYTEVVIPHMMQKFAYKNVMEIPNLQKALNTAKDNHRYEEEQKIARGGISVLSSMKAD